MLCGADSNVNSFTLLARCFNVLAPVVAHTEEANQRAIAAATMVAWDPTFVYTSREELPPSIARLDGVVATVFGDGRSFGGRLTAAGICDGEM